ncbi:leucine-rich repeat domain-containing protein [Acetivibrio cellulolyticus]|uniref:leucine-rich repeat domain-containing protein n=1 Tax=Acetivibrio cellulolyticus TaxID=35830 RepID=UPI0001E3015B|nr:leucine-rich repeat domain-containing protein [Acetivibrio cellulolyticus]
MKRITPLLRFFCITIGILLFQQPINNTSAYDVTEQKTPSAQYSSLVDSAYKEKEVDSIIVFEDKDLETAVRNVINKPEGNILKSDVCNIKSLVLNGKEIEDITPLSNFTELTDLDLSVNHISDLTPLGDLTNLTSLKLCVNEISDLTPLRNLTNLNKLWLHWNSISDLTPLSKLINLTELDLAVNEISNLTPLSDLTNLTTLYLSYNHQIKDLTPLSNLTNLKDLELADNRINDIAPLSNLRSLDYLYIDDNPLYNSSTPNAIHKSELDFAVSGMKYEVWIIEVALGDVNDDGKVNSIDFGYMRKYLLGLISEFPAGEKGLEAADVDRSTSINSIDFGHIRSYLLGKGTLPPS